MTVPCIDARRIEVAKGLMKVVDGMEFVNARDFVQRRGIMTDWIAKRSETSSKYNGWFCI